MVADERPARAPGDLDVVVPAELQDRQRVLGRVLDVDVAHHGGRGDQRHFRRCERIEDRERIVYAGIDVEDQRTGPFMPSA